MRSWGQREWQSLFRRASRLIKLALGCAVVFAAVAHVRVWSASDGRMYTRAREVPRGRVALVLGALVHPGGRLSHTVADRIACATALHRNGKVQRVLVSGDHGREHYDEVNAMANALVARGVPAEHVFLDHAGFRTLDSMHRARVVFGVTQAVVCTQRFHLPRALYLAEAFGIDAVGLVADRRIYRNATYDFLRERVAVTKALFDVMVGREARLLGPKHPVSGSGMSTRDLRSGP